MLKGIAIFLFSLFLLAGCSGGETMQIKSNAFQNGRDMPSKYTCDGKNISPGLVIIDALKTAKSLALIMDDPDSPSGKFLHWLVWNIPGNTTEMKEAQPIGIQVKNSFNTLGYSGPCPPSGTHRYIFRVYALDTTISLKAGSSRQELEAAMKSHVLESAELIGRYARAIK